MEKITGEDSRRHTELLQGDNRNSNFGPPTGGHARMVVSPLIRADLLQASTRFICT